MKISRATIALMVLLSVFLGTAISQRRKAKPTAKPTPKKRTKPAPKPKIVPKSLTVNVVNSTDMICGSIQCPLRDSSVKLIANSLNQSGDDTLSYEWSVTGGKLTSSGRSVSWDLKGIQPGIYTANVKVADQHAGTGTAQTQIRVVDCGACTANASPCPVVIVSCPDEISKDEALKFSVTITDGPKLLAPPTFLWTVSSGTISGGETAAVLNVVGPYDEERVRATVYVGGYQPDCRTITSCTTRIKSELP